MVACTSGEFWTSRSRAVSSCIVSALLRIPSTHFSAPLLRDVAAEVIDQLKERKNLLAICPLPIVDLDAHCEDPGIVFLSTNTQRGLQDTGDFSDRPCLQFRVHQTLRRDDARERHFPPLHVCVVKAAAYRATVGRHGMEPHPVDQLR